MTILTFTETYDLARKDRAAAHAARQCVDAISRAMAPVYGRAATRTVRDQPVAYG